MLLAAAALLAGLFVALEARDGLASGFIRASRRSPLSRQTEAGLFWIQVWTLGSIATIFLAAGVALAAYAIHVASEGAMSWPTLLWLDLGWGTGLGAGFLTLAFGVLVLLHLR